MSYAKTDLFKYFKSSKYFSGKHKNYFQIYENLFSKFRNKNITFVEIGVLSGGSLFMWRKYFGNKAKIIGIEFNPKAKKFEKYGFNIEIGDQSDDHFWKNFFKKYGKVDVILDDGGHTNFQQIKTSVNCVPFIKDNGILVVEDVHTSYMKNRFNNPSKNSFINFSEKMIDDINSRFPGLKQFKYSLKKYVYSISHYESIVAFHINRRLCKTNSPIYNNKLDLKSYDFTAKLSEKRILYKIKNFFKLKTNFTYLVFLINAIKLSKFFK